MVTKLSSAIAAAGLVAVLPVAPASAQTMQRPNPAAVFCTEEGGTYVIVSDQSGQRGVCKLADGREVDAWQFYRDSHGAGDVRMVNPAATYCIDRGGSFRVVRTESGERGLCTPAGKTEMDAWQYYREGQGAAASALPNPAARFCIAAGGTYRVERTESGERGLCTPPGGTEMDAWEFFRSQNARGASL